MTLKNLSDEELHLSTVRAKRSETTSIGLVIQHLAEFQRRRLHLKRGHTNLYHYAVKELKYSEASAHRRVSAARLILEFPEKLESLSNGSLTLCVAAQAWVAFQEERRFTGNHQAASRPGNAQISPQQHLQLQTAPDQKALSTKERIPSGAKAEKKVGSEAETGSAIGIGDTLKSTPEKSPLTREAKREILDRLENKSRSAARLELSKITQTAVAAEGAHRPKTSLVIGRTWNTLEIYFSNDELSQLQRLTDLLSHRLRSTRIEDLILFLLKEGLLKHDPKLKQDRLISAREKSTASHATGQTINQSANRAPTRPNPPASHATGRVAIPVTPINAPLRRCGEAVQQFFSSPKNGLEHGFASANGRTFGSSSESSRRSGRFISGSLRINGPRSRKRIPIPQWLRQQIWIRDEGRCTYEAHHDPKLRCGSTRFLDIDHILPVSKGGGNQIENLRLVCASHNRNRHRIE